MALPSALCTGSRPLANLRPSEDDKDGQHDDCAREQEKHLAGFAGDEAASSKATPPQYRPSLAGHARVHAAIVADQAPPAEIAAQPRNKKRRAAMISPASTACSLRNKVGRL
jgi:hypothetical protein